MAILQKNLCASYVEIKPVYDFLKEYAEGVYFDKVEYTEVDEDGNATHRVRCYIGETPFVEFYGQQLGFTDQSIKILKQNMVVTLKNPSAKDLYQLNYINVGYVTNHGILMESRADYQVGISFIITKTENDNTTISFCTNGRSAKVNTSTSMISYNTTDYTVAGYVEHVLTINGDSDAYTYGRTFNMSTPFGDKVSITPMVTTDSTSEVLPYCYHVAITGFIGIRAINLGGHTYLTNSIFAIQDE